MQDHYTPNGNPLPETSGIYRITCTVTKKFYIGSATNLSKRKRQHFQSLANARHPNRHLQRAWDKYGADAFVFEVLELVLVPFLIEREQYWIDSQQAVKKGFNIAPTAGSNLGLKASPETIEKLRVSHLGQPGYWAGKKRTHTLIWSDEARAKVGDAQRGRAKSIEHRERLRQANLGKKYSEETKRKLSEMRTGRKQSPEAIEKTRIANLGRKNTPEAIEHMREIRAKEMKTVILIGPDGNQHIITGIHQFCKEHHLDRRSIQRVIKGQLGQHKGWRASS